MKRRSIIALIFILATGLTTFYVVTEPGIFVRGDEQLREIASITSPASSSAASPGSLFAIEKESPSSSGAGVSTQTAGASTRSAGGSSGGLAAGTTPAAITDGCNNSTGATAPTGAATDCVKQPPDSAFLKWARNVYHRIQRWITPAATGLRPETGRPMSADQVPLDQVVPLESRRVELNRVFAGAANTLAPAGDAELFYRMMAFVKEAAPNGPAASTERHAVGGSTNQGISKPTSKLTFEQQKVFEAWRAASENPNLTGDEYWRDQKYFYRYAAHLGLGGLIGPRTLTSPENFLSILNRALSTQKNVKRPEFFSNQTRVSLGESQVLSQKISRRSLRVETEPQESQAKPQSADEIGFLLENSGAAFAFIYNSQGLSYEKIPDVSSQTKKVVADLPGPMHADGARLIELGIRGGRVVNFLMGGGARRSGLVVVTPEGRAFPFHVQAIAPAVWGSKTNVGTLDLSRSYQDLISFLTIAKEEKLSVFMEMLLAEEADANAGLTPIKNFANARGRRLLVWKNQTDGTPSLLVVNRDLSINHAVWAAHRLGYRWAVNLDVDFIDGARTGATVFGTANDGSIRNPYSRLLFLDER